MNVLMILDNEFPPDDRVEKEALSLIDNGYKVHLLCLSFNNQPETELYKGIHLFRIRINKFTRNKLLGLFLILPIYRIFWRLKIAALVKRYKIDILHLHDLPLTDVIVSLADKYGLKAVADQHEYYSNWIVNTAHYNTVPGKIVSRFSNWKKYERKHLRRADLVITVEKPLRDIYISEVGIEPSRIIVLPNTPSIKTFNPSLSDPVLGKKYKSDFVIFYAGNIDILRGLNTIIESLVLLRETVPGIKFVLAGRFASKYYDPMAYSKKIGVSDLIDFIGWIPISQIPYYIAISKLCVHVPPSISVEVNNSVATKIYQYIIMGKPIIVSEARAMKSLVENNRIGISVKDSDPEDLARKIEYLYSNPELMSEFSRNAEKISSEYIWEKTSESLIDHYNKLLI